MANELFGFKSVIGEGLGFCSHCCEWNEAEQKCEQIVTSRYGCSHAKSQCVTSGGKN
jgi:hypothetical protein